MLHSLFHIDNNTHTVTTKMVHMHQEVHKARKLLIHVLFGNYLANNYKYNDLLVIHEQQWTINHRSAHF